MNNVIKYKFALQSNYNYLAITSWFVADEWLNENFGNSSVHSAWPRWLVFKRCGLTYTVSLKLHSTY